MADALQGRVISVQVGRGAMLRWRGRQVPSAIDKTPVAGRVALGSRGFAGDQQVDLTVHGGPDKAVCCYADEHLPDLEHLLEQRLPFGAFGENLRVQGLTEDRVHIGDTFTLGTARVQVSQPRGPCFKLAARWGLKSLPAELARGLRAGFYLRVLAPGDVGADDTFTLTARVSDVTVADVLRVTYRDHEDQEALAAVLAVPELAGQWRDALRRRV